MTALTIAALGMGFLGSVHCVGMCGPIVLYLPQAGASATMLVLSKLVYNLGRVATYVVLGAVCGALGHLVALAGFQRTLSITAGVAAHPAGVALNLGHDAHKGNGGNGDARDQEFESF